MATMNVSLPDQMKDWVEGHLKDAQFSNTSDYVRHLIRQDQERQRAIAELRAAIDDGLNSGEPQPFDVDDLKARARAAYEKKHSA